MKAKARRAACERSAENLKMRSESAFGGKPRRLFSLWMIASMRSATAGARFGGIAQFPERRSGGRLGRLRRLKTRDALNHCAQ